MRKVLSNQIALRGELLSRGESAAARRLRTSIARLAETPHTTILVEGERGTWRIAHAARIHALSDRSSAPLVLLAPDPARSFPSQLTDALTEVGHGTLVLEEPLQLGPNDQALLARLLETRSWIDAQGSERSLEARLVATTAAGFDDALDAGRVREDLAYRLNVLRLIVPALRDRIEDISDLLNSLGELESSPHPQPRLEPGLADDALEALGNHDWPGNLRELEAVFGRAAALSKPGLLEARFLLPAEALADDEDLAEHMLQPTDSSLRSREEHWIRQVLTTEGGNRSSAARVLGIHRATLHNKLKEYGIT